LTSTDTRDTCLTTGRSARGTSASTRQFLRHTSPS
jgi:hypothetical protein